MFCDNARAACNIEYAKAGADPACRKERSRRMLGDRSEQGVVALGESIMSTTLEVPKCVLIDGLRQIFTTIFPACESASIRAFAAGRSLKS